MSGIIDMSMRTNPYVPILSSTPARIADAGPGASTRAGGNQVWNGTRRSIREPEEEPQEDDRRV